jgi:tetratricopeptide (TPR) repeat protein
LALYKDSKFDEAIESFRICVTLDPKNIDAWKCAARVFVAEKQYQRAIDVVHKCIPLKPDDAAWYGILGTCFANLKQYGNANDAYRVYASLKPDIRRFAAEEVSSPSDLDEDNDRRDGPAVHGREGEHDTHWPRDEDGKRDDRGRGDEKDRRPLVAGEPGMALPVEPSADGVDPRVGQDAAGKAAGRGH